MSGIWPNQVECVSVLTFDIDGTSLWESMNPNFSKLPGLMSMAEYGPGVAVPRILNLLDDHSIKATFFVPGKVAENHVEMVREIARRGHEVGHHGYNHEDVKSLDREAEEEVLKKGISIINGIIGSKPRGYRAPACELSRDSLSLLVQHGFEYDASLMGDDAPYIIGTSGERLVEIPFSWMLDDFPFFCFAPVAHIRPTIASPQQAYDVWAAEFDGLHAYGRCFTLTMHPQFIGRPSRLIMLERLIKHIKSKRGTTFMRAFEVAEYWHTRHSEKVGA